MGGLLFAFVAATLLSLLLTRVTQAGAMVIGLVDVPDGARKKHRQPIPRAGGSAIFLTLVAVPVAAVWLAPGLADWSAPGIRAFLTGAIAIYALGLADDRYNLPARTKLVIQVAVAAVVFALGLRIDSVGTPVGTLILPAWLSLIVTALWIVALTNAFNLIDGSDGVAGGAALCAALSMAGAFLFFGNSTAAFFALVLAGAALGFLFYNFPPATVFLGDSGSLLLGYSLSALGILTARKAPTLLAIAIPVVACGLPILEVFLTFVRRYFQREPVFGADRGHIHHRLGDMGRSPRAIALSLYGVCALFALLSLLLLQSHAASVGIAFGAVGITAMIVLYRLRIPEMRELHRVLQRSMSQRSVLCMNLRVREASLRLARAAAGREVLEALGYAFQLTDFDACELRLNQAFSSALEGCAGVERHGDHVVWRHSRSLDVRRMCSFHVPVCTDAGVEIGNLLLHRDVRSPQLLVDISLIAHELQEQLRDALLKLSTNTDAATARETKAPVKISRPLLPPQVA